MESSKQKFEKEAKSQMRRLTEIEGVITREGNNRHIYVYSPPGIGKTHYVTELFERTGLKYSKISGAVSFPMFGVTLATLNYQNPTAKNIYVLVDDCESILSDMNFTNSIKNVLEGKNRTFQYNKMSSTWLKTLTDEQQKAVLHHQCAGRVGFEVPTSKFIFIFLSNTKLPNDKEVKSMKSSGRVKELAAHRASIRSRCKTIDLEMDRDTLWGWLSLVVKSQDVIGERLNEFSNREEVVEAIMNWLFHNRKYTVEFSLRTIQKMAESYSINPENYEGFWENEFLDQKAA
jgi:hypothetical protein